MKFKKILAFALGPIVSSAIGFVTLPIIAWFFTQDDIGKFNMLQVILGFSATIFTLSMHQAYVREYHETDNKPALLKTAISPGFLLLLISTPLAIISPDLISVTIFNEKSTTLSLFIIFGAYISFFIVFLTHLLRMQERGLAFSSTLIAPKILVLMFIIFSLVTTVHRDYKYLIISNILSLFFSFLIFIWLTKNELYLSINSKINKTLFLSMLKFSFPLILGGLSYWALTTIDRFFLRYFSSFSELGLYSVAASFASIATIFTTIFSNIWHPIVYRWVKEGLDPKKVQSVMEIITLIISLIWSITGLLSGILTFVLPPSYVQVEYIIVACVAMPLLYMLSETTMIGIGITRKSTFAMLASIGALLVNVILNIILVKNYGASGAAIASAIAFFIFFLIRTEASAILWVSIPRIKIYVVVCLYLLMTILIMILKPENNYYRLLWVMLLFFSLVAFSKTTNKLLSFSKAKIKRSM